MTDLPDSFDVLMATFNASISPSDKDEKSLLIRCLNSVYREIPLNRLIVCDGGSTDNTLEILKRYDRVEIHVRPDLKTMLSIRAFLISQVRTEWFILIDSDIELPVGWFDTMKGGLSAFDYFDAPRRYLYEFEQADQGTRSFIGGNFGRTEVFKQFAEKYNADDFGQRIDDIVLRQYVAENQLRYGRVNETFHWHNCCNQPKGQQHWKSPMPQYEFDIRYTPLPEEVMIEYAYSCAKYVDPDSEDLGGGSEAVAALLKKYVPRDWVVENGIHKWLKFYDEQPSDTVEQAGETEKEPESTVEP